MTLSLPTTLLMLVVSMASASEIVDTREMSDARAIVGTRVKAVVNARAVVDARADASDVDKSASFDAKTSSAHDDTFEVKTSHPPFGRVGLECVWGRQHYLERQLTFWQQSRRENRFISYQQESEDGAQPSPLVPRDPPRGRVADTQITDEFAQNADEITRVNTNQPTQENTEAQTGAAEEQPDTDGDGIPDDVEKKFGFDPNNANSVRSEAAGGDFVHLQKLMQGTKPGDKPSQETAARFLMQASIGLNQASIDRVCDLGFEAWIDEQLAHQSTKLEPYIEYLRSRREEDIEKHPNLFAYHKINSAGSNIGNRNVSTAWMRATLRGDDYLRQRVAFALSQIVVVAIDKTNIMSESTCNYYDMLSENAFGRYEDLLQKVSIHPAMGRYLSHLGNRKADPKANRYPDENYAREIMQLFTIGLWELNPDGTMKLDDRGEPVRTYTNEDIQTLARVFTGLWLEGQAFGRNAWPPYDRPLQMTPRHHDMDAKVALGGRINLPADQDPMEDIRQTVRALVKHPTTAPFISTRLINHLVTSNPSPEYVERVVNVWYETDGNLGAVVKAILLDEEARGPHYLVKPHFGKLKGPLQRCMIIVRGLKAGSNLGKQPTDYPGLQWWNPSPLENLKQEAMRAPSVFNFFEAVYQRPGKIAEENLRSPEFQILNDVTAATVPNYLWEGLTEGFHYRKANFPDKPMLCDLSLETKLAEQDLERLLDHCSLMVTAGTMRAETRKQLLEYIKKEDDPEQQARLAIFGAAVCPEGAILR